MAVDATGVELIKERVDPMLGSSRSISTRKSDFKSRRLQGVPSRYLRTGISSCHDLCKHGRRQQPLDENVKYWHDAEPISAEKTTDFSPCSKEMEVSACPATDHEADVIVSSFSHSRTSPWTPRIKSTGVTIAEKNKVQLLSSSSVSWKIPRTKTSRISMADKGRFLLPTASAVARTRSNQVPGRVTADFKKAKSTTTVRKSNLVKEKADGPSTANIPERVEVFTALPIKDGVSGSSTSSSSEAEGGGITSQLPPLSRQKTINPSFGSGSRKRSSGSKSSSNSSSAESSSRSSTTASNPSTASSSRAPKMKTSGRGAINKDSPVGGSRTVVKSRSRRAEVNSEDRPPRSSQKAQFRRGKVVGPESDNVTALRRLKFRQASLTTDAQHGTRGGTARKGFKRAESSALAVKNGLLEKVVLRHRKCEKTKNVRRLLNNVIEETASILVISRKSKVKALVGAFETVILLQDPKPQATVTAC